MRQCCSRCFDLSYNSSWTRSSASCLVQSNHGCFPESGRENPAVIEGDQQMEKEVQVTAG